MTANRLSGYQALNYLTKKFEMSDNNAIWILNFQMKGYLLPEGDEPGSEFSATCRFYNDTDIYRYDFREEHKIVGFYETRFGINFMYGVWRNSQENPDYPYKLDVYNVGMGGGKIPFRLITLADPDVDKLFEGTDTHWTVRLDGLYFLKTQIDKLEEVFLDKEEQNND